MRNFLSIFKLITSAIRRRLSTPIDYARHIGVNIGDDNFIPDKSCWSSEPYLITVGNHCQITAGVRLFTHGGGQVVRKYIPGFDTFGKIVIEDWVYIGNNSLIMPGVTIKSGSLIAAGSVVTKSIPAGVVVGGNPARILGTVEEYMKKNLKYNIGTKGLSNQDKKAVLLSIDETKFIKKKIMER